MKKEKQEEVVVEEKKLSDWDMDFIKGEVRLTNFNKNIQEKLEIKTKMPWYKFSEGVLYGLLRKIITIRDGELSVIEPQRFWEIDEVNSYFYRVKYAKKKSLESVEKLSDNEIPF